MTRSLGFWNFMAPRYARQTVSDQPSYAYKLAQTQALMHRDMNVLEFGCGTGSTALTHAPHVGQIKGIDYSPKMIDIARSKLGDSTNVHFETATLDGWTAPDASYDMIMGMNILHLLTDHKAALKRAYTLLKPNGYLVTSTACLGDMGGIVKHLLPIGSTLRLLPYVAQFTCDALEADFASAGFEVRQSWRPGEGRATFHICQKPSEASFVPRGPDAV